MRVVALACLALLPGATAVAAQEAHAVVFVQAVVSAPVQSAVSDTAVLSSRASAAGATSSRQLEVSSVAPVLVTATVPGGGSAWAVGRAIRPWAGAVERGVTYPLAAALRTAQAAGASSVTISVAVN